MASPDSLEAYQFAEELLNILTELGWPAKGVTNTTKRVQGVLIRVKNLEKPPPHAEVLRQAFENADVEVSIGLSTRGNDEELVTITVGYKPEWSKRGKRGRS
jgi:hypothetical protein